MTEPVSLNLGGIGGRGVWECSFEFFRDWASKKTYNFIFVLLEGTEIDHVKDALANNRMQVFQKLVQTGKVKVLQFGERPLTADQKKAVVEDSEIEDTTNCKVQIMEEPDVCLLIAEGFAQSLPESPRPMDISQIRGFVSESLDSESHSEMIPQLVASLESADYFEAKILVKEWRGRDLICKRTAEEVLDMIRKYEAHQCSL